MRCVPQTDRRPSNGPIVGGLGPIAAVFCQAYEIAGPSSEVIYAILRIIYFKNSSGWCLVYNITLMVTSHWRLNFDFEQS